MKKLSKEYFNYLCKCRDLLKKYNLSVDKNGKFYSITDKKDRNAGIVYIDVTDFGKNLKNYGEYHKDKNRCFGAYKKARIVFIND